MHADSFVLGGLLTLSVLTAVACEYADRIHRRQTRRRERLATEESGRRGLVRVLHGPPPEAAGDPHDG